MFIESKKYILRSLLFKQESTETMEAANNSNQEIDVVPKEYIMISPLNHRLLFYHYKII